MDNHPIPQDVTGFQFRLIGSLTVKQFAYIAVSVVGSIIIWYLPALHPAIKGLLIFLVGATGPALAFLPVEGRPLDQMASHFLKALLSPNQYVYHKTGGKLPISMFETHKVKELNAQETARKQAERQQIVKKEEKLEKFLNQIHTTNSPLDTREQAFMQAVLSGQPIQPVTSQPVQQVQSSAVQMTQQAQPIQAAQASPVVQAVPAQPVQTPIINVPVSTTLPVAPVILPSVPKLTPEEQEKKLHEVEDEIKKEDEIAKQLVSEKQKEEQAHPQQPTPALDELNIKLQEIMQQKALLEQELQKFQQNVLAAQQASTVSAGQTQKEEQVAVQQPQEVKNEEAQPLAASGARNIPNDQASNAGIPTLPDIPNHLVGIVKDPRGNVIPGVLVEVKDKDDNPVRAFRTNALGQFAAATALPNGTYTILFEDPKGQHKFDIVEVVVKDAFIPLIEVISHDAREELRQSLFG